MQDTLFGEPEEPGRPSGKAPSGKPPRPSQPRGNAGPKVRAPQPQAAHLALAAALPQSLRLGTSSWSYPGWAGMVWEGDYAETVLSRHGLGAYARHPLLRAVSLDRAFYRPLSRLQYAACAAQVPDDFRFVVKAPSMVTDALVRDEDGRGMKLNPLFLDPLVAVQEFVQPALEGLGPKLGALVFQLSPLPPRLLNDLPQVLQRLRALLLALPALQPQAPDGVTAVEVRDGALASLALADLLRDCRATYCLGLHAKMPLLQDQLPLLRRLWPGPLVCRWNLNLVHGGYGYEDAQRQYSPYDRIIDPDPVTRQRLAQVIAGTVSRGQNAFVTVSNHAEGCAPLSVELLAQAVLLRSAEQPARQR